MTSKSLQDQLLALGLARETAGQVKGKPEIDAVLKPKRKQQRRARPEAGRSDAGTPLSESGLTLEQAYRLREKQTRDEAEQARQHKRLEDSRRRRLNQLIREIVEPHRLNDPAAEFSRNFMHKGRIRKVHVTAEQLKALNQGTLGLAYLAGGYHILRPEYVRQVCALSAEHVPSLASGMDEDHDYPVPDDLTW